MRLSYNYILAQGDAAEKKVETSISQTKQTLENQMADFSNNLTPGRNRSIPEVPE